MNDPFKQSLANAAGYCWRWLPVLCIVAMVSTAHGQKLKGFGRSTRQSRLPGFGKKRALESKYREQTLRTARRWMKQYDKNGNGFLDRSEFRSWSAPSKRLYNLNGDGKMELHELMRGISKSNAMSRQAAIKKKLKAEKAAAAKAANELKSLTSPRPQFDPALVYRKQLCSTLASDLIAQYDRNRNKQLDVSEWQGAKRRFGRFSGGADANGDNKITQSELSAWLLRRMPRLETGRLSPPFRLIDINGDGQISLREYSIKHGNGKGLEFRAWDRDNDGLITPRESYSVPIPPGTLAFTSTRSRLIVSRGSITSKLWVDRDVKISDIDVRVSITKQNDNYMRLYLIGPDGQRILLFRAGWLPWANSFTLDGTLIDDEAPLITKTLPRAPFPKRIRTDSLRDKKALSLKHYYGKSARGTWQLVGINLHSTPGILQQWSLRIKPKSK